MVVVVVVVAVVVVIGVVVIVVVVDIGVVVAVVLSLALSLSSSLLLKLKPSSPPKNAKKLSSLAHAVTFNCGVGDMRSSNAPNVLVKLENDNPDNDVDAVDGDVDNVVVAD